jgi:hypothetical protein
MHQAQAMTAPILKMWSDGLTMAAQGLEASQVQAKKMAEAAFEVATAMGKDYLKYADEVRARAAQAAGNANELVKEQAALMNDIAKDPAGATQRVIAGWADGSRKSLEMGADALKGYIGLLDTVWSRMEKASQDTRQNYIEYVKTLQGIVESKTQD